MNRFALATLSAAIGAASIVGCSKSEAPTPPTAAAPQVDPAITKELADLRTEVRQLRKENEELKQTPSVMLQAVEAAIRSGNPASVNVALKRLTDRYASASEAKTAIAQVDAFVGKKAAEAKEAERIASLGLAAIKVTPKADLGATELAMTAATISDRFIFDAYDNRWHYVEAEKGNRWVNLKVSVTSTSKDPLLPGVAAYALQGAKLEKLGQFEYRFARWDDYGSYLGNDSDFRNDFAHSDTIPFALGLEVPTPKTKGKVFVVASKQGCHKRQYDRFKNPPVSYPAVGCATSLEQTLTVEDFKDGDLVILKTFG